MEVSSPAMYEEEALQNDRRKTRGGFISAKRPLGNSAFSSPAPS